MIFSRPTWDTRLKYAVSALLTSSLLVSEWVYDGDAINASHTHQVPCLSQNGFMMEMLSMQAIPIRFLACLRMGL